MEVPKPQKQDYMAMLPAEIKKEIVFALTQSSTVEEATDAIRALTATNKEFNAIINDPITTRTIIRLLVQKFNAPSEYIALKLNTLGAKQYMELYLRLRAALYQKNFDLAESLIKNAGADIDYQVVDIYPTVCGPNTIVYLLKKLKFGIQAQENIARMESILLKADTLDKEKMQKNIENSKAQIRGAIQAIYSMAQEENFETLFKSKQQLDQFISAIDKNDFKKAFTIIEPKTIMASSPTYYSYIIEPTLDMCLIGANFSLLMDAIATNQRDLLGWLIKHKANLEFTLGNGDTALLMAMNLGKKDMVELLIKNGANLNQQNTLQEIREKFNEHNIIGLGEEGVGINQHHLMYELLNKDTISSIMDNAIYHLKETPLIRLFFSEFTEQEHYDLAKLLLENGANPNIQDKYGNTALFMADLASMKLLLEYGANPLIKDNDGMTALDHMKEDDTAEDPEREEKIQLLENAIKKQQKK
jgi:ankyrin repeat protein